VVQLVLLVVTAIILGLAARGDSGSTALVVIGLVVTVLVVFGYPAILETAWHGRTLGKAAFGLRVVSDQGAPITFRHAAIRSALFVVDGLLVGPAIGVIALLVSRDTVRLGDLAAGTVVLRERTGAAAPTPIVFGVAPGWESYVAWLDVSGLSAEVYGLVRNYLSRRAALRPEARARLGMEVAQITAAHLRLPPHQIDPDSFLSCVAAAVQQRSAAASFPP
jgi:uncharacterized RDD family membrane protein YckC